MGAAGVRGGRGLSKRGDLQTSALGERLREERAERGLSLRELARRLEVSASLVSQIETGKIQPSVRTLYAIASELGLSLDELVFPAAGDERRRPATADDLVQRAADRPVIELESGVRWERLAAWKDMDMEFLYAVYEPGGESSPADALVRHQGREFGVVLDGMLHVRVGFDDCVLEAGDSISFESTTPHRLHNEGDAAVQAIWVVVGRGGSFSNP